MQTLSPHNINSIQPLFGWLRQVGVAACALAILVGAGKSAVGGVIYDNTTTSTFSAFGTSYTSASTVGDYVTFASGPSTVTEVSFLMTVSQDVGLPEGNFGLFVYDDDAGTVGHLLGSDVATAYVFPGQGNYSLTFSGLSIPVDTTAFVGLSIENYNADAESNDFLGVYLYNPPTVGSSDAETMLVGFGSGLPEGAIPHKLLFHDVGLHNMAMTITAVQAVPESGPGVWVPVLGLVALTFARHSRSGSSRH